MNRKQLRAKKAYERKHALEIAWRHASVCGDLDDNGNYVRVTDPIAVNALYGAFHKHLLGDTQITFKRLQDEQSRAFLKSGELVPNTVSVMAVTRDETGEFRYAIERCSGGSGQVSELLVAAKVGAANKLLSQCS